MVFRQVCVVLTETMQTGEQHHDHEEELQSLESQSSFSPAQRSKDDRADINLPM